MIQITSLSRRFGNHEVLKDLSLSIERGERVALLGANGSGKTTLLKILCTLVAPSCGDANVAGFSVCQAPLQVRRRIGWMPATDSGFFPRFTGWENLRFFASLRKLEEHSVDQLVKSYSDLVPLQKALSTPYSLSSNGMKQSLALIRALLGRPEILLLDEPMRGLDPETQELLRAIFSKRLSDTTVLFSTHSVSDADSIAHRKVKIKDGTFV